MDSEYHRLLSKRILNVLVSQPLKLCEIIKKSLGAYPDEVVSNLEGLMNRNLILIEDDFYRLLNHKYSIEFSAYEIKEVPVDLAWLNQTLAKLSKPHPADYDWRFTDRTVYDFAQLLEKSEDQYRSIALFGTTTLFPVIKKNTPGVKLSLFNKSQSLIKDIERMGFVEGLYVQDLFSKIPYSTRYDIVVADPPWYNDFYNAFICRASEVMNIGGLLYLSVLPVLTRPNAEKDRNYIDQCCKENGFKKIESFDGFLNYESPNFEIHSLNNNSIKCFDWRRGDLVIYKKIEEVEYKGSISKPNDEPLWEEFIINGIKLKLLKENDLESKFSFEFSDKTNTLSTVSRRSPIRKRINFWTSDNFAFKISKLKVLRDLFTFVNAHNSLKQALINIKINEKLSDEEYNSLITLLKTANIIHSG